MPATWMQAGDRFNGATTKESWKSLVAARSACQSLLRLQWGHDEGVVEGKRSSEWTHESKERFNGATTKESWKATAGLYITHGLIVASMGPRRRSRGRQSKPTCGRRGQSGFNGATTKESWKASDRGVRA